MIPTRSSRPFGRTSPRVSDTDLARLIDRTIELRVKAKREQGYAAVNVGCDGRKRTTMFDGSVCQTEGEVCIATRQDGISACIEAPTQGNGLTLATVAYRAAVCEPVTGWWILDNAGDLYRIPTDLCTVRTIYPVEAYGGEGYDLVRAGTWDRLRCSAALTPPTNNEEGSCTWESIAYSETVWGYGQVFTASVGGALTWIVTAPGITAGVDEITIGAFDAYWNHVRYFTSGSTVLALDQDDRNGITLIAGQEYKARVYATPGTGSTADIAVVKGNRGTIGATSLPAIPVSGALELGRVTVAYGGDMAITVIAVEGPTNWEGLRTLGADTNSRGIVHRDYANPNPGTRYLDITIPASDPGVVSGLARVAYGYPLAMEFFENEGIGTGSPYGVAALGDTDVREDHDMALVYSQRAAIEYAPGHVNIAGAPIDSPADAVVLADTDPNGYRDTRANIIQFPGGDIGIQAAAGGNFQRLRVRPAPTDPLVVTLEQTTPTTPWPDTGNAWIRYQAGVQLLAWTLGDTTFTSHPSDAWGHTRALRCVLWQYRSGYVETWDEDPDAKWGYIDEPSGTSCSITFDDPGGAPAAKDINWAKLVSFPEYDARLRVTYGWTFTANGIESALSPLAEANLNDAPADTFAVKLTVPVGPTGTTKRHVYRFAWDPDAAPPNLWGSSSGYFGGVYDRMMRRIAEIDDNVTTEVFDDDKTTVLSGSRPPSPFLTIGAGVTFGAPSSTYALAPLNLT